MRSALLALLVGCSVPLYSDPGPKAVDAGDMTALITGCGKTTPTASIYCRLAEGTKATGSIYVYAPPTTCGLEACAVVTVYPPDGSDPLVFSVPEGRSVVEVPLSKLLGPGPITKSQRGFWPILLRWSWKDQASGVVMQAAAEGEVRLRVYSAGYTPLSYDPAQATWTWKVGGKLYQATDAGRTAAAP